MKDVGRVTAGSSSGPHKDPLCEIEMNLRAVVYTT